MSLKYSPSANGFYLSALHPDIPADAVEISAEDHIALLQAQAAGARIEVGSDGVPVAVFRAAQTEAELLAVRTRAVSAECRRRIYAEASAEAQMNMATATAAIAAKPASARTEAEAAILAGTGLALQWVAAMRETYRALSADPAADYLADAAWPPLDEAVRSMIAANF